MASSKRAVVVMAPEDSPEGRGRILHAFVTARDLAQVGDVVEIYLDGNGVTLLSAFATPTNPFTTNYRSLFDEVIPLIQGACDFCARVRFDATADADAFGIELLGGEGNHHSLAYLVQDGYEVLTF